MSETNGTRQALYISYGQGTQIPRAQRDRLRAVLQAFNSATEHDSQRASYWEARGTVCMELGYMREAKQSLRKAYSLSPASMSIACNLHYVFIEREEVKEAKKIYRKIRKLPEETNCHHYYQSLAAYNHGDLQRALQHYHLAYESHPDHANTFHNLRNHLEIARQESVSQPVRARILPWLMPSKWLESAGKLSPSTIGDIDGKHVATWTFVVLLGGSAIWLYRHQYSGSSEAIPPEKLREVYTTSAAHARESQHLYSPQVLLVAESQAQQNLASNRNISVRLQMLAKAEALRKPVYSSTFGDINPAAATSTYSSNILNSQNWQTRLVPQAVAGSPIQAKRNGDKGSQTDETAIASGASGNTEPVASAPPPSATPPKPPGSSGVTDGSGTGGFGDNLFDALFFNQRDPSVSNGENNETSQSNFPGMGSRDEPAFGDFNLKIGPFEFDLSANTGISFNDNILLSPDKESDIILSNGIGISTNYAITRSNKLRFGLDLSYIKYINNSELDNFELGMNNSLTTSAGNTFDFEVVIDELTLLFFDDINVSADPFEEPGVVGLSEFGRFRNELGVDAFWDLNDLQLKVTGSRSITEIFGTSSFDFLNRWTNRLSTTASANVKPWLNIGFTASTSWRDFDQDRRSNSITRSLGPNAQVEIGDYIDLRASLQKTTTEFDTDTQSNRDLYTGDFEITHDINAYLDHSFNFQRTIRPGVNLDANNFVTDNYQYDLKWQMSSRSLVSAGINHLNGDQEDQSSFTRTDVQLGMNYIINSKSSVSINASRAVRDGGDEEGDYDRNLLDISYQYNF